MPETLEMRLSDSFEQKEGMKPAVECVAKFININYGNNAELRNAELEKEIARLRQEKLK